MSRMYDTIEPNVIDDDMLMQAVEERGYTEEAGKIAKEEGYDLDDVTSLRLDFRNILKIDNLWCFNNLTKLQLDNNIIETIEGLETLTKLTWLDLSFNNIEVIEGLDSLTELRDLSLFNNRVVTIENMDALTKLQIFSIGNNNLKELDTVNYLRKFKDLRTLNVAGNPFCKNEDCHSHIISYLPQVLYLDYQLVTPQARAAAIEKYQIALEEIMDNEKKERLLEEEEKRKSEAYILHEKAFVENMDGPWLFDQMYAEDSEGKRLSEMPGVSDLIETYKHNFMVICKQIHGTALVERAKHDYEEEQFWECVKNAKSVNKSESVNHINTFLNYKRTIFDELSSIKDQNVLEKKIVEYNGKVSKLWDTLMGLEMQLVDQLEEVVKEFERNIQDMVMVFSENVQGYLAQCRELENTHNEKMIEIAMITLEKVVKSELEEEISEELRMYFIDKDTIIGAITASHDVHLLKIDNKEDDIVTRVRNWAKYLIEQIHVEEEDQRNRKRVSEINHLIDYLRDEVENLDLPLGNV